MYWEVIYTENKNIKNYFLEPNFSDIKVLNIGEEICKASHSFGPSVRPNFLIHYVVSGKGFFICDDIKYFLERGQAFIIFPEKITYYEADYLEPWHYIWIGFSGVIAKDFIYKCGFSKVNYIYTQKKKIEYTISLLKDLIKDPYNSIKVLGYFNLFFGSLIENNIFETQKLSNEPNYYLIKRIADYITNNYWENIKIAQLAKSNNLDRSYFSRIFKKEMGVSPQQFLLDFRMQRAKELLKRNDICIGDCARSVGYKDQLVFSKIFKSYFKVSPTQYRKIK